MASISRSGVNLKDNTVLMLAAGGLALVYFVVLKPSLDAGKSVAEMLNLKDTEEEKEEKKAIVQNVKSKGWDPSFYKTTPAGTLLPTQNTCVVLARNLIESAHWYNDDEERIYGTLRQLKSQAHLSRLSEFFYNAYKQGLYDFLKNTLELQSEMAIVAGIINPLPNYIKGGK